MQIIRDNPTFDREARKAASKARYEALVSSIEAMDRAARMRLLWTSTTCFGLGVVVGLAIGTN